MSKNLPYTAAEVAKLTRVPVKRKQHVYNLAVSHVFNPSVRYWLRQLNKATGKDDQGVAFRRLFNLEAAGHYLPGRLPRDEKHVPRNFPFIKAMSR